MQTLGPATPNYSTWRDNGGNIGIKCTVCGRDHWDDNQPATDPIRGKECLNCLAIKDQGIRSVETTIHQTHKKGEPCFHRPIQPEQDLAKVPDIELEETE